MRVSCPVSWCLSLLPNLCHLDGEQRKGRVVIFTALFYSFPSHLTSRNGQFSSKFPKVQHKFCGQDFSSWLASISAHSNHISHSACVHLGLHLYRCVFSLAFILMNGCSTHTHRMIWLRARPEPECDLTESRKSDGKTEGHKEETVPEEED